jgi:hypothetical protein
MMISNCYKLFSFKEQLFYTREDALQLLNEISIHPLMKKAELCGGKNKQ